MQHRSRLGAALLSAVLVSTCPYTMDGSSFAAPGDVSALPADGTPTGQVRTILNFKDQNIAVPGGYGGFSYFFTFYAVTSNGVVYSNQGYNWDSGGRSHSRSLLTRLDDDGRVVPLSRLSTTAPVSTASAPLAEIVFSSVLSIWVDAQDRLFVYDLDRSADNIETRRVWRIDGGYAELYAVVPPETYTPNVVYLGAGVSTDLGSVIRVNAADYLLISDTGVSLITGLPEGVQAAHGTEVYTTTSPPQAGYFDVAATDIISKQSRLVGRFPTGAPDATLRQLLATGSGLIAAICVGAPVGSNNGGHGVCELDFLDPRNGEMRRLYGNISDRSFDSSIAPNDGAAAGADWVRTYGFITWLPVVGVGAGSIYIIQEALVRSPTTGYFEQSAYLRKLTPSGAAGNGVTEVIVAGRADVPADATAVVLNVSVTNATGDGFVTVWGCGSPRPLAASMTYAAGETVATAVVARPGTSGKVCVYSYAGTDVIVDVGGYIPAGAHFDAPAPARLFDSRPGYPTVDGLFAGGGRIAGGATTAVPVTGRAGVAAGAAAVVLSVSALSADSDGFVTVWPCGLPRPNAASLNFTAGSTRSNTVISAIGDNGDICVFSNVATHLVVDSNGALRSGEGFVPTVPARLLDTRPGYVTVDGAYQGGGALRPLQDFVLPVANRAGLPDSVSAVTVNIAVTNPAAAGWVSLWPCGTVRPPTANLTFTAGQTISNAAVVAVGSNGTICITSFASADVVVDVTGAYQGSLGYHAVAPSRLIDTRNIW